MNEPLFDEMDMVEDALQSWPRAQTPRGFSSRVLQRIENTAPHASLKFRLTWLDVALGLFAVLSPVAALFIWNSLPIPFVMRLQFGFSVLESAPQNQELILFSLLGLAGLLALFALAAFLFFYPVTPRQKNPGH